MPISNTIQEFREGVIKKGGPQIASKYKLNMFFNGSSVDCYPLSVVLPGRNFSLYEQDLYGPVRKVPYKRGYTQCNVTFLVYQDWRERKFLENWMNLIVYNVKSGSGSREVLDGNLNIAEGSANTASTISEREQDALSEASLTSSGTDSIPSGSYRDYANYKNGRGVITIQTLSSLNHNSPTSQTVLKEAYPAFISPLTLGSDGTGYPTFTVGFQFNQYEFT
jgi:hypothetical protein